MKGIDLSDGIPTVLKQKFMVPSLENFEFGVSDPICHASSRHSAGGKWDSAAARLADPTQSHIPAAGHFSDWPSAEVAWGDAIHRVERRLSRWRSGSDAAWPYDAEHPFIAEVDLGRVIGGTLTREEFNRGIRSEI